MTKFETIGGEPAERDAQALLSALNEARKSCGEWNISRWEEYLNAIDPNCMSYGHDRIREVALRMHLFDDLINSGTFVVTVAGTNGKGSTSALIAKAMQNLDFKVGLFTSPHLFNFNERIQIEGKDISDELLSQCLSEVIAAQFPGDNVAAVVMELDDDNLELKPPTMDAYDLDVDQHDAATANDSDKADCACSKDASSCSTKNEDKYSDTFNHDDQRYDYLGSDGCGFGRSSCATHVEEKEVTAVSSSSKEACDSSDACHNRELDSSCCTEAQFADETRAALEALKQRPRPLKEQTVELSYFEITTLAAMRAFMRAGCEILVLEVGLGGRLDCVNIFYNDVSVITSIGMDHMKILGDTSKQIAYEKAGIINPYGTVVVGSNMDDDARHEVMRMVKVNDATAFFENDAFSLEVVPKDSHFDKQTCCGNDVCDSEIDDSSAPPMRGTHEICYKDKALNFALYFPYPKVPVSCAGIALSAIFKINQALEIKNDFQTLKAIENAIRTTVLPGRMQHVASKPDIYLDVAHNVPAAIHLRDQLLSTIASACSSSASNEVATTDANASCSCTASSKRRAVIGMLKDKDIEGVLEVISKSFDAFYVASLTGARGESKERLAASLNSLTSGSAQVESFDTVEEALAKARADSSDSDTIIVMGSFITVAQASKALQQQ